jgi:hypothetical protein
MWLRQSTASQEISLGPFLDSTDGDTEEGGLTIANTDIKIRKHGATTLANKNSGGATVISNGVYQCTLDATDTDTAGQLEIYVHVAGALAVKNTYVVLTATAFDALLTGTFNNLGGTAQTGDSFARLGAPAGASVSADVADLPTVSEFNARTLVSADYFDPAADLVIANMTQISGDATAADNLEAMYDGTGYTDDLAPATQGQVGAISSGSSSGFNYPVTADNTSAAIDPSSVAFVGGTPVGTFANTESDLTTVHQIPDSGDAIDLVYKIEAGATNVFTSVVIDARATGGNDEVNIQLYDHIGADWETVGVISGTNGTALNEFSFSPFLKHTGALGASEAGNLYLRFVCSAQSNPELFIARVYGVAVAATSTMGYENGTVWVDESNGTSTGTTQGVDGIFANQCDDFDNGQTIADNLGTSFIHLHPGNSITLTAALQGYNISNVQCTLNGGSQNCDSTRINGGFIAGTWARAGTGIMTFVGCSLTNVTSDRCAILGGSGLVGTFTLTEAGLYPMVDCQAAGATGITTLDFASLGGATVNMERWAGNLTVANMAAGDTLNLHSVAGGDIVLGGVSGTVSISGVIGTLTDNRTGSPTLTDNSVLGTDAKAILADTNELQSDDIPTLIAALPTASEINAEMVDVMEVDTHAQPSSVPAATTTYQNMLTYAFTLGRNKMTQTATTTLLRNDADSATIGTSTVSDDATTFTKGKFV